MSAAWTKTIIRKSGSLLSIEGERPFSLRVKDLQRILNIEYPVFDEQSPLLESAVLRDEENIQVTLGGIPLSLSLPMLQAHQNQITILHNSSMVLAFKEGRLESLLGATIVLRGSTIVWIGPHANLKQCGLQLQKAKYINLGGRLVTPGLVDCHAHPLFAGKRAGEFSRRSRGDHYLDIAKAGGGINATVQPTRNVSLTEHVHLCSKRMQTAISCGTTTMEAKSGYDLSVEGELRLLRAAHIVDATQSMDLMPTLLGAHTIPPEFQGNREGFIKSVIEQMIPQAASEKLATAVDVYCDEGAFTLQEMCDILSASKANGLATKAHVGQFADLGGPQALATLGALSGDHLEQVSEEGIAAMAKADMIATMLPGACVQLRMTPPPVAKLRAANVKMAIASDLNPGTSHSESLALPMWLATTHYQMNVEEAWLGVTKHAADALGRNDIGQIAPGYKADLVVWNAETHDEIPYHFGVNLVHQVFKDGHLVKNKPAPFKKSN